MYTQMLKAFMATIAAEFDKKKAVELADKWLDKLEEQIQSTPNKIDDKIFLPMIRVLIREPLGIEDNDD